MEHISKYLEKHKVTMTKEELKSILDPLLDIAEECYPKYYSSDQIARILDFYKKYLD